MLSLRIAVLAASFPPTKGGGVASAHYQLAKLFRKTGAEVRLYSFLDDGVSSALNVRRDAPDYWKHVTRKICTGLFRLLDPSGRAYQTADILECWPGALKLRRELIAFDPQEIILPDHGCPGLALGAMPAKARVSLAAHHNPMRFVGQFGLNPHSRLDARLAVALENIALKHVHRVVAPCNYMADSFHKTYRFNGPVDVIPNLIDPDELDAITSYDPRPLMGLGPNDPLVYVPSAGSRFKGSALLTTLLARLKELAPRPFGVFLSGTVSETMKSELSRLLPVHAPGPLAVAENLSRVKSCDIALSPTLIENFSMALLEAQLLGLPVASFDVGGNAELIAAGRTGLLSPLGDTNRLAADAAALLEDVSAARRKEISALSRERFDPDRWLPQWLN